MLSDVLSLRLTCKSNNERRRFPVYGEESYHELEANVVEEWLGFGSCRFVSSDVIYGAMLMHGV